jgi:hypothetical protein
MNKVRWFNSRWVIPLNEISEKMLLNQYNEKKGSGFLLSKSTSKIIIGKFIEKKIINEEFQDPFGIKIKREKIIYNITKFIISYNPIGLELINPPRGIRFFLNSLQKIIGFGLVISEIKINPLDWLYTIEKHGKCNVNIIVASGIKAHKNGVAKVTLSGISDIRNEFNNFIKDEKHTIDCIKLTLIINKSICKLELYKNASAKIALAYFDEVEILVKKSLFTTYKKANK